MDPEAFLDYYEAKGWKVGSASMKDWKAACRNWERRDKDLPGSRRSERDRLFIRHGDPISDEEALPI